MTDFNPFSEAQEPAAQVDESESSGSRKTAVAVGALAAVALGAGAFLFLGGGEADEELAPIVRAKAPAAAAASPKPAPKVPAASKVTLGRNPFRALYVEPEAAPAAPAAPGTNTAPTTTTGGTPPIVVVGGAPQQPAGTNTSTGGAPAPAPAQPAPAPAAQSTVSLKGVTAGKDGANPTGTFVYDGKEVTGAPGDVMADKLLVISLQQDATGGWFANLQLGDGAPFEVHERQTVVVQ